MHCSSVQILQVGAIAVLIPRCLSEATDSLRSLSSWRTDMKNESPILLTVLIIVVCCGIGTAQECQIGCQSKIDALKNEVAALDRALAQQVPYLEKFNLTPVQRDPSHSPFAEQALPNYLNVLLVHITLDDKPTAVLVPSPNPAPNPPTYAPTQSLFSVAC